MCCYLPRQLLLWSPPHMWYSSKWFLLHHSLGGSRGLSWTRHLNPIWTGVLCRKCSFNTFYFNWYWDVISTNMTANKWLNFPLMSHGFTFELLCLSNLSTSLSFFFSSFFFSHSFCGGKKRSFVLRRWHICYQHRNTDVKPILICMFCWIRSALIICSWQSGELIIIVIIIITD